MEARGDSRRAPIVAVTGGKGGVGKTMLAVNAALAVARTGRRVLLVDLDLGLADVGVLLGRWLSSLMAPQQLERAAGVLMVALGLWLGRQAVLHLAPAAQALS